jgi:hypothetical protein
MSSWDLSKNLSGWDSRSELDVTSALRKRGKDLLFSSDLFSSVFFLWKNQKKIVDDNVDQSEQSCP